MKYDDFHHFFEAINRLPSQGFTIKFLSNKPEEYDNYKRMVTFLGRLEKKSSSETFFIESRDRLQPLNLLTLKVLSTVIDMTEEERAALMLSLAKNIPQRLITQAKQLFSEVVTELDKKRSMAMKIAKEMRKQNISVDQVARLS